MRYSSGMSLEKAIEEVRYKANDVCAFVRLIDSLSKEDKETLLQALENKVPDVTLASALRKEGWRVAEYSIARHRKGTCRCLQTIKK